MHCTPNNVHRVMLIKLHSFHMIMEYVNPRMIMELMNNTRLSTVFIYIFIRLFIINAHKKKANRLCLPHNRKNKITVP